MGLDIYFTRHKNSNPEIEKNIVKFSNAFDYKMSLDDARRLALENNVSDRIDLTEHSYKDSKNETVKYTDAKRNDTEDVAYFRKHNWLLPFFDYGDNCSIKFIGKDDIERIISAITEILSADDKEAKAENLLQTEEGFFFGNQDYDESYFLDLRAELDSFKSVLKKVNWEKDLLSMYCWW